MRLILVGMVGLTVAGCQAQYEARAVDWDLNPRRLIWTTASTTSGRNSGKLRHRRRQRVPRCHGGPPHASLHQTPAGSIPGEASRIAEMAVRGPP